MKLLPENITMEEIEKSAKRFDKALVSGKFYTEYDEVVVEEVIQNMMANDMNRTFYEKERGIIIGLA